MFVVSKNFKTIVRSDANMGFPLRVKEGSKIKRFCSKNDIRNAFSAIGFDRIRASLPDSIL